MFNVYKFTLAALLVALLVGCGGDKGSDDKGSDDKGSHGSKGSYDTIHNQGKSCITCHDFNGATVFATINAPDNTAGAAGYRVQLGDADVYNSSNGQGNSNFYGSSTQQNYTAHVIDANGNIVRSSGMNTHDNMRLDCNRCHTDTGANGAPGRLTP